MQLQLRKAQPKTLRPIRGTLEQFLLSRSQKEETVRESRGWDVKFSVVLCAVAVAFTIVMGSQLLAAPALGFFMIHLISKNALASYCLSFSNSHRIVFPSSYNSFRLMAVAS